MTQFSLESLATKFNIPPAQAVKCACGIVAQADMMIYIGNLPAGIKKRCRMDHMEYACDGCRWKMLHLHGVTHHDLHLAHGAPSHILNHVKKIDNAVARAHGRAKVHKDVD